MVEPEMDGVAEAEAALKFWAEEWSGPSFMAIGADDPDVETMRTLRGQIRGWPGPERFGLQPGICYRETARRRRPSLEQ